MRISTISLDAAGKASGTTAAIDVMRAFTTAAFAFDAGAERILLVSTVEEAFALRRRFAGALTMGEVAGRPIEGFDFGNSPAQFAGHDLHGKTMIQRTTAGTQGAVRAVGAEHLFVTSFVVAEATARAIRRRNPEHVSLIATGVRSNMPGAGVEDIACADYLTSLLRGEQSDPGKYLEWAVDFVAKRQPDERGEGDTSIMDDMRLALMVNRFAFALAVTRQNGLLVMKKECENGDSD